MGRRPILRRIKKRFTDPALNGIEDTSQNLFSINRNDTVQFHYFPEKVMETKKPNYNSTVKRAELPTFEYINTNPRQLTMKLFFNDIGEGQISHDPSPKSTLSGIVSGNAGIPLGTGIVSSFTLPEPAGRKSTSNCIDILESWLLPTDLSLSSEGESTAPHLELIGIGTEIFECYIYRLNVDVVRWTKEGSIPTQAFVDLGLRESFRSAFPLTSIDYTDFLTGGDVTEQAKKLDIKIGVTPLHRYLPLPGEGGI